jgi:aminopeptidase YwaD
LFSFTPTALSTCGSEERSETTILNAIKATEHFFSNIVIMIKNILWCLLLLMAETAHGQDSAFARKMVDTLSSSYFWGRGYTKDGMKKAASFIEKKFIEEGLLPLSKLGYLQKFSYSVNTFPGKMELSINGNMLTPGKDFIVSPASSGLQKAGALQLADSTHFVDPAQRFIVSVEDKLTWSVAPEPEEYTMVQVDKHAISSMPASYIVAIENVVIKKYEASNIAAMVKGTARPDSFIVLTAHYDHLGGMGTDTYFPGANDNASGVALLLNLAAYYTKNPCRYSMVFIAFAGEEAGLLGSKYFTEHPLLSLKQIRFLLNTDLAGTGDEGITIVNATLFSKEFGWVQEINQSQQLLQAVNARGKAANSDHYWFTEKKVPCFYFYTLGGIKAYHDVLDRPETLPLTKHENICKLLIAFVAKLTSS